MSRWPHDDTASMTVFYGDPDEPGFESNLTSVIPPFKMTYEGHPIKGIRIHRKCASALRAALNDIWAYCGESQAKVDKLGVSRFSGSYNNRSIRGSSRKSCHAFGAAIDLDASNNGLGAKGVMPQAIVRAFKKQGAFWGGDFKHRKDPMHFQFANEGPTSVQVASLDPDFVPNMQDESDHSDEDDQPKSMLTSKIGLSQAAIGVGGASEVIGQVSDASYQANSVKDAADNFGVTHTLGILATKPLFWIGLIIILAACGAWYWRWRDHGRGQKSA